MTLDFASLEFMAEHLLDKNWIFAKTMPDNPHWYTLKKEWEFPGLFELVVSRIRDVGYEKLYGGRAYSYVNINGFKYWSMGAAIDATILINRAELQTQTEYDSIAQEYDAMFGDADSLRENLEVMAMLDYKKGSVLDIGCGTGLLLDYLVIDE